MGRTDRLGLLLQASEVAKQRLAGKAVSLLQFEATALFLLLRSGTLLQTVSRDLKVDFEVGQRGKGVLQRRQEVFWVEGRVGRAYRCDRLFGADIRMRVVPHLA